MYPIIERFMQRLTKEQVNDFALKNNVFLSEEELEFLYSFLLKNWSDIIQNPNLLDLERYKSHFSSENFTKIKKLTSEYLTKYSSFL